MSKSTIKKSGKKSTRKATKRAKKPKYKYNRPDHETPAYKAFVKAVRERDNCKCQFPGCNKRKFGIEVHHIIRYHDAPALRYNPNNGICLCGGKNGHHALVTGNEMAYAGMLFAIVQVNITKQEMKRYG